MESGFEDGIGADLQTLESVFAVLRNDLGPGTVPDPDYFKIMLR